MIMNKIRRKIAEKILAKIPAYLNPVDFLHDLLNISKESIYRRIKGEVAFTLDDMVKISSRLFISVDEIIYTTQNKFPDYMPIIFQFHSNKLFDPDKIFSDFLSAYIQNMEIWNKAQNIEILVTANRLFILMTAAYEHLFKFYYYKWIHQTQQKPLSFSMSDIVLSDHMIFLKEKLKVFTHSGHKAYILDYYFLKNTIRDIQYYYKRKLISDDEILLLQKDLFKVIDTLEYSVKQKKQTEGYANYIYVSTIQVESSGIYCKYDDKEAVNLWISYGINIRSENPEICTTYRFWFNSLKKYSSLITGCNEILQAKFIEKQRIYAKDIKSKDISQ